MDLFPLIVAIVWVAMGVFAITNVDRMTSSDSASRSFLHRRRGKLTLGWLFVLLGVLWGLVAVT